MEKENLLVLGPLTETLTLSVVISLLTDPQSAMTAFLARAAVKVAKPCTLISGCIWQPFF